jgi:cystathionine beta-lyase/cystathionine gamma-synthase
MKKAKVNSPRIPIYRDTGFELYDAETAARAFQTEKDNEREPEIYIYSRYRNPTVVAAEQEIMKLERSRWALLTQSGMSAIDTAVSIFQDSSSKKPWLFFTEIYGGTISYIESVLKNRRGLDIRNFTTVNGVYDMVDFENVMKELKPEFVYVETVSNPLVIVADIPHIISVCKKYKSKVIVDNTFATPLLFRPLEYGADIVIHSATKYFSGHGNLTAGVICGNDTGIMKASIEYRKLVGHMLSPDDAYRLTTQLMTFELRFSRQCENALNLASLFNECSVVEKVYFPGLKSHPTYQIARNLFGDKYFGAMMTIDFKGRDKLKKRKKRDNFISHVTGKIKVIPTLGDPQTILLPIESVWGVKYPEPGMVRLSAGFENYSDLEAVISGALDKLL